MRLRQFAAPYILDPASHVAEPIVFEISRNALPAEVGPLTHRLKSLPLVPTPPDLWQRAVLLGQACRRRGYTSGAMDLLIGAIAQSSEAVVVTLDQDFEAMGEVGKFQVKLLKRPGE